MACPRKYSRVSVAAMAEQLTDAGFTQAAYLLVDLFNDLDTLQEGNRRRHRRHYNKVRTAKVRTAKGLLARVT